MHTDWQDSDNTLSKTFVFSDFAQALEFVNKVGAIAEEMGHHPDICIKAYNTVSVTTTTHDAGSRVTQKDHDLAEAIDGLYVPS